MRMRFIFCLMLFAVLCAARARAQSPNGTISGVVLDPSGAVIAGADILMANDATGVQYSAKTNSQGIYLVSNLPPGTYRLQVSKIGFKTLIKPDIILSVQDALAINFTLPVGAASEIVTVTAGAPLVNTQSAAVSTVIDRKFVETLPLNGRSFNTLLQLTPGVVIAPVPLNNEAPGQFSISGQRTDANSFMVDGVSANFGVPVPGLGGESGTGGAQAFSVLGGTSSLVSVDALQEFRVETSSFAPEFGRSPGGQVILTTRSGTNELHGEMFDYFRNTVMDANDWFANRAGKPRAPEHHNDFGAFLGGAIRRNRTFFFASYEGARLDQPQTLQIEVPSEFARASAPSTLAPYIDAYPRPDDRTVASGVYSGAFTGNYANSARLDAGSIRADQIVNSRVSLFVRFSDAPSQSIQRQFSLSDLEQTGIDTETLTGGLNVDWLSGSADTLRANYSRQSAALSFALDSFGGAVPLDPALLLDGFSPGKDLGEFEALATSSTYLLGSDGSNRTRQMEFTDDLAIPRSTHQIKLGGDYRAIFLDEKAPQFNAEYFVPDFQTFLSSGEASLSTAASVPSYFLSQSLGLYAQDTWKAGKRFNLTYGLRWELSPAPAGRGKTTLAAWSNTRMPANAVLAPSGTPLWNTTYTNFAPRFGLAYALSSRGDFVLRAGGGIFYDLGSGAASNLGTEFPNTAFGFISSVSLPVQNLAADMPTVSAAAPYPNPVQGFDQNLILPRSYQWNLAIEKSFLGREVLSASYVGQAGRNLLRQQAIAQPNANFTGFFLLTRNDALSNYDALELQFRRPLASGLQMLVNYTWSHSLDNASNDVVTALSDAVISGADDYGSSSFDVRHSLSAAFSYDLPAVEQERFLELLTRNWSVQGVLVARSGFPFNGVVLFASPGGVLAESRPDRVPGVPVWISSPAAPGGRMLNPLAFSVPSPPRQGTEARNDIAGFGLSQFDLSLQRKFPLTERIGLHLRADAFNLLNHPNFANPLGFVEFGSFFLNSTRMLNQGLGGLSPLFQEGGPRSLQLSLKLTF